MQDVNAALSRLHSNVEPYVSDVKRKLAVVDDVEPLGPDVIVVSGVMSYVTSRKGICEVCGALVVAKCRTFVPPVASRIIPSFAIEPSAQLCTTLVRFQVAVAPVAPPTVAVSSGVATKSPPGVFHGTPVSASFHVAETVHGAVARCTATLTGVVVLSSCR